VTYVSPLDERKCKLSFFFWVFFFWGGGGIWKVQGVMAMGLNDSCDLSLLIFL